LGVKLNKLLNESRLSARRKKTVWVVEKIKPAFLRRRAIFDLERVEGVRHSFPRRFYHRLLDHFVRYFTRVTGRKGITKIQQPITLEQIMAERKRLGKQ
jgi:hypothetical protein